MAIASSRSQKESLFTKVIMAEKTILSSNQKKILLLLSREPQISGNFYLTGGTALAEFYLHHRLSEDLDFFSEKEFDPQAVFIIFSKLKKAAGIKKIDFQQSFNRNLYFLELSSGETIKTEFTYFPFPEIEKRKKIDGILVDGLLDIAVNKIFTVYQKPRARDFIDLYFIAQKTGWTIGELVKKARIKFDWHIDPLQLGSQFMSAVEARDYPRMIKKIDQKTWQDFFIQEAKKLGKNIFE